METVAIFYEGTIVYWSGIIISVGILSGFLLSLSLYVPRNKYGYGFCIYFPISLFISVIFSRMLHWYCYKEQYEGLSMALKDYSKGGYLLPGVLFGVWVTALLLAPLTRKCSRFDILDPLAPGLALIIAIIKYCDIYSDLCRGKIIVGDERYHHLPFSVITPEGDYRFASFYVTFILMVIVFIVLLVFYYLDARLYKQKLFDTKGHIFRMFLVLYGVVEIVMDSTRYDAAHFYFPGEALAVLNKGTGFMGLSQLVGALCCLGVFIYYMIISVKTNKWNKKNIISLVLFVIGLGIGGTAEYLVQRYFGNYKIWYLIQVLGVTMIAISVFVLYFTGVKGFKKQNEKAEETNKAEDIDEYCDKIDINKNVENTDIKNDSVSENEVTDDTLTIIDLDETQNIYRL